MEFGMPKTAVEKIIARAAGLPSVSAGDVVEAAPDFVLAYELRGYSDRLAQTLSIDLKQPHVFRPERIAIFVDHRVPSKSPEDEAFHQQTKAWTQGQNIQLFEREGIGHQVAAEQGYAVPGALVVHFDSHICQLGTFGTLAFGFSASLIAAFSAEKIHLKVPYTGRLWLSGDLRPGVTARDVIHGVIHKYGVESFRGEVVEICGPGVDSLSLEDLQVITGLVMFTGAVSAFVAPSAAALKYTASRARLKLEPVKSDEDAVFSRTLDLDLSLLNPTVLMHPSPANAFGISELEGLSVQAGYIGSCASGRLSDLHSAARVLKGRRVADGFSLNIIPTSKLIMAAAASDGSLAMLIEAGAFISSPSCDFCSGRIATLGAGQRAVSTGTVNTPGRMGHATSEIVTCSAAVVAASAITGKLSDPRSYFE